jgi:hypothetical protein
MYGERKKKFQILSKSCRRRYRKQIRKREAKYVWRNIEVRLCNHCYSAEAISIKQSECVSVALQIQHAMRIRHIVIFGLSCGLETNTSALKSKRYTLLFRTLETIISLIHSQHFTTKLPFQKTTQGNGKSLVQKEYRVKKSHYMPGQVHRIPGGWGSYISRQLAHESGKVVSPTHWPKGIRQPTPSGQEIRRLQNYAFTTRLSG